MELVGMGYGYCVSGPSDIVLVAWWHQVKTQASSLKS